MGKVGHVLQEVLETHSVSQYRISKVLGIERNTVYRWVKGKADPNGDTIVAITLALHEINPAAAKDFVYRYLGEIVDSSKEE